MEFFFQPADIVTQILNFGLPAPIDVQVVGTDMQSSYGIAQQIANRMRHIPGAADVHVQQLLSLPTLHMDIERTRVTQVGLTARDVAQSALVSLSGSFQTAPNFWLNPKNEVTYQIAVQAPQYRMTRPARPDGHSRYFAARAAIDGKPGAIARRPCAPRR